MESKVIILTEAGKQYGYGHLIRCLAIAQGFKDKGMLPVFYIRGDCKPAEILQGFEWHIFDWISASQDISGKIVIVDSYYADERLCRKIYGQAAGVLFIDDFNRIPYPGGFVLNSVLGADAIDYPCNESVTYLFGPEYHPLRKEFWEVPVKVINEVVKKVLITFGGTDITNETPHVLRSLQDKYPEFEKRVIIGEGFSNVDEIKDAADENTTLIMQPDAEKMKEEMLECDIAVSAAGQTIYEFARIGTPTFAKKVVDNQDYIIKNWKDKNFLLSLDTITMIPDYNSRNGICNIGRNLVDGKGVQRIVGMLTND